MKKLIIIIAVLHTTTSFAQTIPSSCENDDFRLEYQGYTTYNSIGYVIGVANFTDTEMDVMITWEGGIQVVHLLPFQYNVFWFPGAYVQNSRIRARVISNVGIAPLTVRVAGNYYF